jgi:hypothetical protein
MKWAGIVLAAAIAFTPHLAAAQKPGDYGPASSSVFVGRWSGSTDWAGTDYDNGAAWWEFRPDGTFVDNFGAPGVWEQTAPNAVRFTFRNASGADGSVYTGALIGEFLLGTMTNGEISGVFALRR